MSTERELSAYYDNEAAAGGRAAMGSRGRRDELRILPGSLFTPPFRPGSFDAGWTMSTLLHVPDDRFHAAMEATVSLLRPGSPVALVLWGGVDREFTNETDHFAPPRFFSLRSDDRVRAMLEPFGTVELFESWQNKRGGWTYQFIVLRTDEVGS